MLANDFSNINHSKSHRFLRTWAGAMFIVLSYFAAPTATSIPVGTLRGSAPIDTDTVQSVDGSYVESGARADGGLAVIKHLT